MGRLALGDARIRVIPLLHARAVVRSLAGEFARAPWTTASVLLVALGSVTYGVARVAAVSRESGSSALLVAGTAMALLAAMHRARGDRGLLRRVGVSLPALFAVEYLLLMVPVTVLLLWSGRDAAALAMLGGAVAIAVLPVGARRAPSTARRRRIGLPLPGGAFEWAGALRRLWFLLVVAIILTFLVTPLVPGSTWPALGALGVLACIGADGYVTPPAEGWLLVHAFGKRPRRFLLRKIALGAGCYLALVSTPIAMLIAVSSTMDRAVTGALAALVGAGVVTGAILTKYAVYRSGERASAAVVTFSLGAWLASVLMAPPLTIFLGIALWLGAAKRVAPYLPSPGQRA